EKSSEHPLADGVVKALDGQVAFLRDVAVENITGQGISGTYDSKNYLIGNAVLLKERGITVNEKTQQWIDGQLERAHTVIHFMDESTLLAAVAIADKIKPTSVEAISRLQSTGVDVYMLTGDN